MLGEYSQAIFQSQIAKHKGGALRGVGGTRKMDAPDSKGRWRPTFVKKQRPGPVQFGCQETTGFDARLDVKHPIPTHGQEIAGFDEESDTDSGRGSSGTNSPSGSREASNSPRRSRQLSIELDEGAEERQEEGESLEQKVVRYALDELHDFGDSSDWVVQVRTCAVVVGFIAGWTQQARCYK